MSHPHRPIALFDLDGTLADYETPMRRDLARLSGPGEPQFGVHDHSAPAYLGARIDLVKARPGWWLELPRLETGFAVLELARELGFHVQILTAGPHNTPAAWAEKVAWCQARVDPGVHVTVTEDKSQVFGAVLVDDTPPVLEDWLRHHPRGQGILVAGAANEGYAHPRVTRVSMETIDVARELLRSLR